MAKESVFFKVANINDKYKFKQIKERLDTMDGVLSVSVNSDDSRVAVDFDNTGVSRNSIEDSLSKMGYKVTNVTGQQHIT